MEDELRPGVNVEEDPLFKALEVQQKRVLDALEMAVLQAINDIRKTFDDLTETHEKLFELRLYEEVAAISIGRVLGLEGWRPGEPRDPRIEDLVAKLKERIKTLET